MNDEKKPELNDDAGDNHFAWLLGQLRKGNALDEASQALRELVRAVRDTGRKGTVTLKLTVAPLKPGQCDVLTVGDDLTVKPPELEKGASIFFPTDQGSLQRNDPRQTEFPADVFREKPSKPEPQVDRNTATN